MTSIQQKRTRTIYQDQISNSMSIRADETLVPVLIKRIDSDKTKTGNNPGSTYYKVGVICMAKEPTFVRLREKKVKVEGGDGKRQKYEEAPQELDDNGDVIQKGTTIKAGDEFLITMYDKSGGGLDSGTMAKFALTTGWYNDHYTFSAGSVVVDSKASNVLSDKVYNEFVIDTKIAQIPTTSNFSEDDFEEGTNPDYMYRSFVLPLSAENNKFSNVEIQVDDEDTGRFFTKVKDSDEQFVGVNTQMSDKTSNSMKVVYTPKDEEEPKVLLSLAYHSTSWSCFGITDVNAWIRMCPRLIFNAVEWYVYGSTKLERLNGIIANKSSSDGDDEDEDRFEFSTGFASKMSVNIKETVKAVGVPVSLEYIVNNYGEDSEYEQEQEIENHPINGGYRINVKRNRPFVINVTELSTEQIGAFIKDFTKVSKDKGDSFGGRFYAIFDSKNDEPYETPFDNDEDREAFIVEKGHQPVAVFAINK